MLTIDNLEVALDADVGLIKAIAGLSLCIQRGETFALVGESGCGKSMTALALMRLLPENGRIHAGRVVLDQENLLALPESDMRAVRGGRIGMIFQEPSTSLNPVMRVGDQIVESIELHTTLRGTAARAKAIEWLGRVGIAQPEQRVDDYPFRMSGGQKQRVMIAMALACEPDFLVADEPTTALDVTIQAQILQLLKQLQAEQGMGLLLITHDLAVVSGMAHQVALMYAGQIIEMAPAAEFFAVPQHPYACALLQALPGQAQRGSSLAAIAGTVPPLWQSFQGCRFAPRCDRVQETCHHNLPELIGAQLNSSNMHAVRCFFPVSVVDTKPAAPKNSVELPAMQSTAQMSRTPITPTTPLLQVQHLSVRFAQHAGLFQRVQGFSTVVNDVSFTVAAGQTLALVGESGCGKTTTGKAIVQLLRGQAHITGQAVFNGQDLCSLNGPALHAARREVQIIFQDPYASLNPRMRVLDILEEGLMTLHPEMPATTRRAALERLVDQVGLQRDALQRWPHEFSGGQRQRIAIARALAVSPRLIVCDEPTSALDVSVQAQILNLLQQLQRELGVSYLFITHNIGVVEYIADHVVVMNQGRIEETGAAQAVLTQPSSAYTRTLLAAVPRLKNHINTHITVDQPRAVPLKIP
jgi:peptide/nickel transport system ATP-binding protein